MPVAKQTLVDRVSQENTKFWDELCGTQLAKSLGIVDQSAASLKIFDDWFFDFYPYLDDHIPFDDLGGRKVLEIGLGYGSVAQKLVDAGAIYTGLDIAASPVAMAMTRIAQSGRKGTAVQGSILSAPFGNETFDCIVAIGCLHHTGNLQMALKECHRLLVPGGKLTMMVYYAYSYRRWVQAPGPTGRYMIKELAGYRGCVAKGDDTQRAAYDANSSGSAAPHTDWISITSLSDMCADYKGFQAKIENIDNGFPLRYARPRADLLRTRLPSMVGLDLYATLTK